MQNSISYLLHTIVAAEMWVGKAVAFCILDSKRDSAPIFKTILCARAYTYLVLANGAAISD